MEALAEGLILAQKVDLDLNTVMEVVKVADFRSPLLVSMVRICLKTQFFLRASRSSSCSRTAGLIKNSAESVELPIPALRCRKKSRIGRCAWLREGKRLRRHQGARKRSGRRGESARRGLIDVLSPDKPKLKVQ